jgi:hypothetical protein
MLISPILYSLYSVFLYVWLAFPYPLQRDLKAERWGRKVAKNIHSSLLLGTNCRHLTMSF